MQPAPDATPLELISISKAARIIGVEWAEANRKLSEDYSNGGRFIVARVEVARGPMLWATEPGVKIITLQACTQLLKTTFRECRRLLHAPGSVPDPGGAAQGRRGRDFLEGSPGAHDPRHQGVAGNVRGQARDVGNALAHKQFPGGQITTRVRVVGADQR